MAYAEPFQLLSDLKEQYDNVQLQETAAGTPFWKGVLFTVAQQTFITPLSQVWEIVPTPTIKPVPGVKPFVQGLIQIRGELVLINDLDLFLTGHKQSNQHSQNILIVENNSEKIGFSLSHINKMVLVQGSKTYLEGDPPFYLREQVQVEGKNHTILDFKKLMQASEFLQVSMRHI